MELFESIKKRRSIRKFLDKDVDDNTIKKLIEAAAMAPSGMNEQPWHFAVIKDREKKKRFREIYEFCREKRGAYKQDCSFVEKGNIFVICYEKEKCQPTISVSLACENLMLAATGLGFGSLIMTTPVSYPEAIEKIKGLLEIPENIDIMAAIIVGYPDENPEMKPRKPMNEILHFERW